MYKATFILPLILTFIAGCSEKKVEMIFPEENWQLATPAQLNVDETIMLEALEYLKSECGKNGLDQTMIIRNGYQIFGGDSLETVNNIYSSTKSVTSTILGLLIEDGVLTLDTKGSEIDAELATLYPETTLRHFTTMTSGYSAVGVSRWGEDSKDWALDPFEIDSPLFKTGEAYAYWDEAQMMFGRLLTIGSGRSLESIFKERIADPIGLSPFRWWSEYKYNDIAINNGCTGLYISAQQLGRFGHLFLNKGKWKDKQLVNSEWVVAATSVQVPMDIPIADTDRSSTYGSGNYGYNWWVNGEIAPGKRALPDAPPGLYYASGFNNNMCFVIPEWNMVVVRMGMDSNPEKGKKVVYNEFFKRLAPAVGVLP